MSMYPIASGSLTGAGFNITTINQNFTHLQLRLFMRSTAAATTAIPSIQFNNDQFAVNYNSHYFQGDSASATSGAQGANTYITLPAVPAASATSGIYGSTIIDILDYTNTNKNKTIKILGSYDANGSGLSLIKSGLWFATPSAITTINLGITTGWDTYSRFDLYGISTANATGA